MVTQQQLVNAIDLAASYTKRSVWPILWLVAAGAAVVGCGDGTTETPATAPAATATAAPTATPRPMVTPAPTVDDLIERPPLDVRLVVPTTAKVGDGVPLRIEIMNTSDETIRWCAAFFNLVVMDQQNGFVWEAFTPEIIQEGPCYDLEPGSIRTYPSVRLGQYPNWVWQVEDYIWYTNMRHCTPSSTGPDECHWNYVEPSTYLIQGWVMGSLHHQDNRRIRTAYRDPATGQPVPNGTIGTEIHRLTVVP